MEFSDFTAHLQPLDPAQILCACVEDLTYAWDHKHTQRVTCAVLVITATALGYCGWHSHREVAPRQFVNSDIGNLSQQKQNKPNIQQLQEARREGCRTCIQAYHLGCEVSSRPSRVGACVWQAGRWVQWEGRREGDKRGPRETQIKSLKCHRTQYCFATQVITPHIIRSLLQH